MGVHGRVTHILAAIKAIRDAGVPVWLHAVTDGRDVAPKSALDYLPQLEADMAAGADRNRHWALFAMDRDNRWERVSQAYGAMIKGEGRHQAASATAAVEANGRAQLDEFVENGDRWV